MSRIVVRFRAPTAVSAIPIYVDTLAELIKQTTALFLSELKIQVDYPEGSPRFIIADTDLSGTIPGEPDSQGALISRLRSKYRYKTGAGAKDFVVYFLEVKNYDGFTLPNRPDLVLDVNSIGCTWVLAHELGHVLGYQKNIDGHESNSGHVMYPWPCDILNPPPEFAPNASATYASSKYCQ